MERIPELASISDVTLACRYDEYMRGNRFRQQDYRRLAREVVRMGVPPGGRMLDIGTGPGFVALEVARRLRGDGCRVVGLDLSRAMLALAGANARRRGLEAGLSWQEGDAEAMPFGDDLFDCVVSSGSLHHWQDPARVFDEISRVLKGDGTYLIHDLKRLDGCLPRLSAWLIGLMVPPGFRIHYRNSIQSAYTVEELECILARSMLQDWRIRDEFRELAIVKRDNL